MKTIDGINDTVRANHQLKQGIQGGDKMKGILLEDYNSKLNDYIYKAGQKVNVFELNNFKNYATYYEDSIDWIPKHLVEIIK